MSKVIDLESRRHPAEHKRKEARTDDLRDALRTARQAAESKDESSRKLLRLFKSKPPKKP